LLPYFLCLEHWRDRVLALVNTLAVINRLCCQQMETNVDSVYAIGDVAQFPLFIADDASVNIQHWQMAHQHGVMTLSRYYTLREL